MVQRDFRFEVFFFLGSKGAPLIEKWTVYVLLKSKFCHSTEWARTKVLIAVAPLHSHVVLAAEGQHDDGLLGPLPRVVRPGGGGGRLSRCGPRPVGSGVLTSRGGGGGRGGRGVLRGHRARDERRGQGGARLQSCKRCGLMPLVRPAHSIFFFTLTSECQPHAEGQTHGGGDPTATSAPGLYVLYALDLADSVTLT